MKEIRTHPEKYEGFVAENRTLAKEIRDIERNGTHSGQLEIAAFAEYTGVPVNVSAKPIYTGMAGSYRSTRATTSPDPIRI